MRFARGHTATDPLADLRRLTREALDENTMVKSAAVDGARAVIVRAGEDRALISIRPADIDAPALFQSSVLMRELDDAGSAPIFEPPVTAEALETALRFLARARGRWTPDEVIT
jgi:hypothetical protein